jgi:lysylphosphatidylglycerol synthetase-like protein (DUF2156 family)
MIRKTEKAPNGSVDALILKLVEYAKTNSENLSIWE